MRSCWVCGNMLAEGKLRCASRQAEFNYTLMMCIAMSGQMEVENAREKAEGFLKSRQFCHVHVVHAAQYLLAEMAVAGRRVSYCDDPSAGGRTPYVSNGDIPVNLVAAMNRNVQNCVTITTRGISNFINDAFKRYYGTTIWPLNEEAAAVPWCLATCEGHALPPAPHCQVGSRPKHRFFYRVFNWTKPAIEDVYNSHQQFVLEMVRGGSGTERGLHLAADGAYDSRGYSALIGKVVLADTRTKLVLHTEVLHRAETGGVSGRMEIEGLRRLLNWVKSIGLRVESLTTDRSKSIGALLRAQEQELGAIRHYYDGWHLTKWLGNQLLKVSKEKGCHPIKMWIEDLKTHLWKSIEVGSQEGESIVHIFNSCLMHVRDVHEWPQEDITWEYRRCGHGPLVGPRPESLEADTRAYKRLRDVVLTQSFQRDLPMASPYGGTSICEAKNALDRIYCRKEVFYPISTYPLYTMMATMHINTLTLAELSGERSVVKISEVQRKYLLRKSKLIEKSPAEHLWRRKIFEGVLARRLAQLNNGMAVDDNNNVDNNLEQEL